MEARVISAIAKAELSHQNLKKLMNSFFLSFFISKMPCKAKASIYATYQLSFSPFTKCASSLPGLNTSIGFQLGNSLFPFLSLPFPSTPVAGWMR
jgi:hypothetical protein